MSAARALIDIPEMDARKIGKNCLLSRLLHTRNLAPAEMLHAFSSLLHILW